MAKTDIKLNEKELHQLPVTFIKAIEKALMYEKQSEEIETLDEKQGKHHAREGEEEIMKSRIMTVQEVAAYLRICRFSVYNLVKRGELPAMKVLNKLRFDPKSIEQYLNKQKINIE